jgi:hypothetical protein
MQTYLIVAVVAVSVRIAIAVDAEPAASVRPLPHAHAHNDYYHRRPLLDALDQGFTSVEADVFPVDGQLLVGHFELELTPQRSLETLYLKPLAERARANGGRVYPNGPPMTLLVDIKSAGAAAFALLQEQLHPYRDVVSSTDNGKFTERAITVIISGDRPIEQITAANPRYAGIDGRVSDLASDAPADLMPLISDHWGSHFRYTGEGDMPDAERQQLREIVAQAHAKGRRVRFWATPENPKLWQELRAAEVDLIGTDDLSKLADFFRE